MAFHDRNPKPDDARLLRERTQSQAFRAWFGASRVVDAEGRPRVVFHSTSATQDFSAFKTRRGDIGMHFGTIGQASSRADYLRLLGHQTGNRERVLPVYLALRNPLRLDDMGSWDLDNMQFALAGTGSGSKAPFASDRDRIRQLTSCKQIRSYLIARGYDGIVYRNIGEVEGSAPLAAAASEARLAFFADQKARLGRATGSISLEEQQTPLYQALRSTQEAYQSFREAHSEDSWIAFRPSQIKSIFNSGAWDPRSSDILDRHAAPKSEPAPKPLPQIESVAEVDDDLLCPA